MKRTRKFDLIVKYIYVPSEIALTKIVNAKMKIIREALPMMAINLLTRTCPAKAANVATATR